MSGALPFVLRGTTTDGGGREDGDGLDRFIDGPASTGREEQHDEVGTGIDDDELDEDRDRFFGITIER